MVRATGRVNRPKGQIDPGGGDLFGLGKLMLPMGLRAVSHDEQTTMLEIDGDFFARDLMAKVEAALGSEADGGNCWLRAQFLFVVLMPAHSLFAFVVKIGEA